MVYLGTYSLTAHRGQGGEGIKTSDWLKQTQFFGLTFVFNGKSAMRRTKKSFDN